MKLLKYSNFKSGLMVNENLDQAKKLLRDTYKNNKLVLAVDKSYETDPSGLFLFNKAGDVVNAGSLPDETKELMRQKFKETKVTPEENAKVEKGELLKKIRELIGDKLGYAYLFTYLFLVEKMPYDDLKDIFAKLVECKDLLTLKNPTDDKPLLRRPISNYIDPSIPNNGEDLADDLENISLYKSIRKIYNELTPELKKDYDTQPPVIKKQVEELALSFAKLGLEDGKINKDVQERLWKLFFGEVRVVDGKPIYAGQMRRFKNIRDFIKSAQNYLKNIDNTETVKFYEMIEKCNDKFKLNGVKVCFDESNVLILEIRSFQANQMMNSHTRHCIKDSIGHWDSYVGSDNNYNKQYYIYNFNLPSYDTNSVIGITIAPKQDVRACHKKDDDGLTVGQFKTLLSGWQKAYDIHTALWPIFAPMTPEEIEEKKRRVVANREVVKKGLSLDQVKKYLEDGADVNTQKGQALDNAVVEGDIEKIKFLLDYGASPNMREKQEATVNKIAELSKEADEVQSKKAFQILKLLLNAGADLTPTVFKGLLGDYDAVKFCIENGMDPNFAGDLPTRLALKRGFLETFKLLFENGAGLNQRLAMAYAYEGQNRKCVEYLMEHKLTKGVDKSMIWLGHSPKLNAGERLAALKEMQKWIDEGKIPTDHLTEYIDEDGKAKPTYYRITDPKHHIKNATYKDVVDIYGSLYNQVVKTNYETLKSAIKD